MIERALHAQQGENPEDPKAVSTRVPSVTQEPPRIAILDDDEAVRAAIGMLVESMGWEAVPVSSAERFMKDLDFDRVACLVLDLHMPGIDGARLLEMLKELHLELPVVVITAFPDESLADRARTVGVRKVLGKPFNSDDLVEAIRETLPR